MAAMLPGGAGQAEAARSAPGRRLRVTSGHPGAGAARYSLVSGHAGQPGGAWPQASRRNLFLEDDMANLTCPTCEATVKPTDLICFTCGANLPRDGSPWEDDAPAPTTIMQEYLRREDRPSQISASVLRLSFPTGNVEVPAGTSLLLGRDPAESLVAAAFSRYENVSRRHATVTVDDLGHATIRDEHSTNGTFVNGDRVLPGTAVRLADGDVVRLAADASAEVLLPRQEPDPSSLSRPDAQ
jgi:pSer/pThr/pTyr-binding forkhead associated (FHA) protein